MHKKYLIIRKFFLPLFITQFLGAFNDNVFKNALLIWVAYSAATIETNLPFVITFAAGIFVLPFIIFSAIAGNIADKYERAWLSVKIKQIEVLLMIIAAICFYFNNLYGLLTMLFLMGAQSSFFGPIKYSILPEYLQKDELIAGNGLIEGSTFIAILLGTIIGGLTITTKYGVELISAFIITIAIIGWFSSTRMPPTRIADANIKINWNIFSQTIIIIQYTKKQPLIWKSILGISWFWFIGAIFLTQFPIYTKQVIWCDSNLVTLFLSIFSIGIAVGSFLCNSLLKSKITAKFFPLTLLCIGVFTLIFVSVSCVFINDYIDKFGAPAGANKLLSIMEFFTLSASSWLIISSLFIIAVFGGICVVPLYAVMQQNSERSHLSRVIAANNIINSLFMVCASVFALLLFSLDFTLLQLFIILSVINIIIFILILRNKTLNNETYSTV